MKRRSRLAAMLVPLGLLGLLAITGGLRSRQQPGQAPSSTPTFYGIVVPFNNGTLDESRAQRFQVSDMTSYPLQDVTWSCYGIRFTMRTGQEAAALGCRVNQGMNVMSDVVNCKNGKEDTAGMVLAEGGSLRYYVMVSCVP